MQFQQDNNPYAPPTAQEDYRFGPPSTGESQIPADRGTRWFARFIDGLLSLGSVIPVMIVLFSADVLTMRDLQRGGIGTLLLWAGALPVAIYQWSLIARTGQTLGKKWLRIRIVKVDGSPLGFGSGVVLREWITSAIGIIPIIGPLINLVGILMIFGDERRCLHDRIAGTKVVMVLNS